MVGLWERGWDLPASIGFPPPTPLTLSFSISYPVLGFLGPDTAEVIIQLLNIQWNSHEVTSSVKRNKTENKIHPER